MDQKHSLSLQESQCININSPCYQESSVNGKITCQNISDVEKCVDEFVSLLGVSQQSKELHAPQMLQIKKEPDNNLSHDSLNDETAVNGALCSSTLMPAALYKEENNNVLESNIVDQDFIKKEDCSYKTNKSNEKYFEIKPDSIFKDVTVDAMTSSLTDNILTYVSHELDSLISTIKKENIPALLKVKQENDCSNVSLSSDTASESLSVHVTSDGNNVKKEDGLVFKTSEFDVEKSSACVTEDRSNVREKNASVVKMSEVASKRSSVRATKGRNAIKEDGGNVRKEGGSAAKVASKRSSVHATKGRNAIKEDGGNVSKEGGSSAKPYGKDIWNDIERQHYPLCPLCKEKYTEPREFRKHLKVHGIRRWQCKECPRCYDQEWRVKVHFRYHSGFRPVHCKVCNKGFCHNVALRNHIRCVHEREKIKVTCEFCKLKVFQENLKNHLSMHEEHPQFKCDICKACFPLKSYLKRHLTKHDPIIVQCGICSDRIYKNSLQSHLACHNKTKKQCEVCGAKLSNSNSLKLHMSMHNGEQPYTCDICGRKFARKTNMQTHLKLHAGIKHIQCECCGKRFSQKWNLQTHVKSCHK